MRLYVALNRHVKFKNEKLYIKNGKYIFTALITRKDPKTGQIYYQAELTDPTTENSVIICRLEEIESE